MFTNLVAMAALFWLLWRSYMVKHPIDLMIEWLRAAHYLFAAPDLVDRSYIPNASFTLPTPENYYLHVSSPQQIKELSEAPEEKLSLHALAKDMMRFEQTMSGLVVHDVRNANGHIHFRVVGSLLRSNLMKLHHGIRSTVAGTFAAELASHGQIKGGWTGIRTFSMVKNLIRTTNSLVFFGENLTSDPEYLEALLQYPEDVVATSEVLRYTPNFLASLVASVMMRHGKAVNLLMERLVPVVEQRIRNKKRGNENEKPLDIIQWMVDSSPKRNPWTATKITQVTLGLWFGSIHQPAMAIVYALYDLCKHPEYIGPLREEVACHLKAQSNDNPYDHMILLDSFLKESARFSPSDSISLRRKALAPFSFSDGAHVNPGDVACIPMRAIMQDEARYPDARTFDGYRFVDDSRTGSRAKFTDVEMSYPIWGYGKRACPGRFYAAHVEKTIIAHLLMSYDFRFCNEAAKTSHKFSWRSAIIPYARTKLLFRKRIARDHV